MTYELKRWGKRKILSSDLAFLQLTFLMLFFLSKPYLHVGFYSNASSVTTMWVQLFATMKAKLMRQVWKEVYSGAVTWEDSDSYPKDQLIHLSKSVIFCGDREGKVYYTQLPC